MEVVYQQTKMLDKIQSAIVKAKSNNKKIKYIELTKAEYSDLMYELDQYSFYPMKPSSEFVEIGGVIIKKAP